MTLTDRLWLPDGAREPLVRGNVKLELFDDRTGKKQDEVKSTNYVTDILTQSIQYTARGFMRGWLPGGSGVSNTDTAPTYGAMGFWLTTATSAEAPTTDRLIRGGMTAYSFDATYTGTSAYRGTLNIVESSMQPTKIVFVIDWPTNAGNGTIGSVYTTSIIGYSFYGSTTIAYGDQYATTYGTTWTDSNTGLPAGGATQIGLWLDPDGSHYWTMWSGYATGQCTMVQRVINTGVISSTVSCTGMTVTPFGWTNDGVGSVGNWWFCNTSLNLQKYPAAGATTPTNVYTGVVPSNGWGYMCFGSGFIYSHRNAAPQLVDQFSPTTGALVTTITLPIESDQSWAGNPNAGWIGYLVDSTNGDTLYVPYAVPSYTGNTTNAAAYSLAGAPKGDYRPAVQLQSGGFGFTPAGVVMMSANGTNFLLSNTRSFFARSLLPSAVTKSSTQTMKLTYEFDYT